MYHAIMRPLFPFAAFLLLLAACAPAPAPGPSPSPAPRSLVVVPDGPEPEPTVLPVKCVGTTDPDPMCTPGAVVAATKAQICASPAVHDTRPPLSWTAPLKQKLVLIYGAAAGTSMGAYELDHLVPLELGGAGWDVRNLWPEVGASPNPKDGVENAARTAVCAGKLDLAEAQWRIATDWQGLGRQLGVPVS